MKKILAVLALLAMSTVAHAESFLLEGPICNRTEDVHKVFEMWEDGNRSWPKAEAVVNADGKQNCTYLGLMLAKVARTDFLGAVIIKNVTYYSYRAYVVGYKWRNAVGGVTLFGDPLVQYFYLLEPLDDKDKTEGA